MINSVFKLESPGMINVVFEDISLTDQKVIVKPNYLSICPADQRYFSGQRSRESLDSKLPMALIHEACGTVVRDTTGSFKIGQKVLLVPNEPEELCEIIGANYLESSKFRSSGHDGFMQEYVSLDAENLVPYDNIDPEVAAICELVTVGMHAVTTFIKLAHQKREHLAVYGDGSLGYVVALLLKNILPDCKVSVIGTNSEKLSFFSFVDDTYIFGKMQNIRFDHAFECVGGSYSSSAIESIIKCINPEGTITLMGVSENPIPINTRLSLEKGLRFVCRSRSTAQDFIDVRNLLEAKPILQLRLHKIVVDIREVSCIADMHSAFKADQNIPFKTVLKWNI